MPFAIAAASEMAIRSAGILPKAKSVPDHRQPIKYEPSVDPIIIVAIFAFVFLVWIVSMSLWVAGY